MINHPDIFVKAKQEIDAITGTERLPTFADRESLPFSKCLHEKLVFIQVLIDPFKVEAILNETWRWGCPVPLSELLVYVGTSES